MGSKLDSVLAKCDAFEKARSDAMRQINVKSKLYGYTEKEPNMRREIRSETNPDKTPWLKVGSSQYKEVLAAIEAQETAGKSKNRHDSFDGLVDKLKAKGYSGEYATKIAGKVANEKRADAGKIFGHDWEDLQRAQQGGRLNRAVPARTPGKDYGSEPAGNGMVKMVPSGDIVTPEEAVRRLRW